MSDPAYSDDDGDPAIYCVDCGRDDAEPDEEDSREGRCGDCDEEFRRRAAKQKRIDDAEGAADFENDRRKDEGL